MSARALVFGASGQIGRPLLARLRAAGWTVDAVSRQPRAAIEGVRWLQGELAACDGLPVKVDAIFSCGPLDAFARWYARGAIEAERVVAFGSTSVHVKRDSRDPAERDVAARLAEGERALFAAAQARGASAAVLRPTLVYGGGADRTLSRIAALGRRWGRFVLPRGAVGLRAPVHVDDLAAAAIAACAAGARGGFDLPGGEALPYREMVARVLAALEPPARLIEVPAPLFALLLAGARAAGLRGLGDAALARMREDLVFDAAPARAAFGYAPRAFRPDAGMFG
ncbi:MAG TPA: NAD(P)-dependent oxidoreductase [Xanthomonadaceae bacterium]|nr:NAD(P)-dependent oxidoreductase [Xanthomonadaceae bacterium]HET6436405.1 NAD(P)-dependent oxidoreductase [Xanthomonadaceae bacterium]